MNKSKINNCDCCGTKIPKNETTCKNCKTFKQRFNDFLKIEDSDDYLKFIIISVILISINAFCIDNNLFNTDFWLFQTWRIICFIFMVLSVLGMVFYDEDGEGFTDHC